MLLDSQFLDQAVDVSSPPRDVPLRSSIADEQGGNLRLQHGLLVEQVDRFVESPTSPRQLLMLLLERSQALGRKPLFDAARDSTCLLGEIRGQRPMANIVGHEFILIAVFHGFQTHPDAHVSNGTATAPPHLRVDLWPRENGYLPSMSAISGSRRPIGGAELAVAGLIAVDCLAINALAVAHLPELSLEALGPLALAYHDKQPHPVFIGLIVLILLLGTWLPRAGRAAVLVFAGAVTANFASASIWDAGVPDYIVVRNIDVIANVSDVLMFLSAAVVAASISVETIRRARSRIALS